MKKIKIYLAKSNLCNPEVLMHVRAFLNKQPNVEIVEYKGGQYRVDDLKSADCLIVIPPVFREGEVNIGKGLSSQITDFTKKDNIVLVTGLGENNLQPTIAFCESQEITDVNWQNDYATCTLQKSDSMSSYLDVLINNPEELNPTEFNMPADFDDHEN